MFVDIFRFDAYMVFTILNVERVGCLQRHLIAFVLSYLGGPIKLALRLNHLYPKLASANTSCFEVPL
jgi:hypothetical protein